MYPSPSPESGGVYSCGHGALSPSPHHPHHNCLFILLPTLTLPRILPPPLAPILPSPHPIALRLVAEGCYTLTSEADCLASADGRSEPLSGITLYKSPCHWCCGASCTDDNNKCEPYSWLLKEDSYAGKSRNGVGYDSCPSASACACTSILFLCIYICMCRYHVHVCASTK